jgi:hypothetical protein
VASSAESPNSPSLGAGIAVQVVVLQAIAVAVQVADGDLLGDRVWSFLNAANSALASAIPSSSALRCSGSSAG